VSEFIIAAILAVICIGQVIAVYRSPLAAVTYYICAGPLLYFQVWAYVTWDPMRACGIILLVGSWLRHPRAPDAPGFFTHPLSLLLYYGIITTIVWYFFWPLDTISSRSSAYSTMRPLIAILNWGITLGVAWRVGLVFSKAGAFEKARPIILMTGLVLCLYAVYQYIAYHTGLPLTGIRVAVRNLTATAEGEANGLYTLGGEQIYRPCSFVGEPKTLGAFCTFWLALLLPDFLLVRKGVRLAASGAVFVLTLGLTASTGAWLGGLFCLGLFPCVRFWIRGGSCRDGALLLASIFLVSILLTAAVLSGKEGGLLGEIVDERLVSRLNLSSGADLNDTFENHAAGHDLVAMQVLTENPHFVLFGVGQGGIAYYMAEMLGGERDLIIYPTIGLLILIADIGITGLLVGVYALAFDPRLVWFRGAPSGPAIILFAGSIGLAQYLNNSTSLMMSVSAGLLLSLSIGLQRGTLVPAAKPRDTRSPAGRLVMEARG
jgi:hypothetical protein